MRAATSEAAGVGGGSARVVLNMAFVAAIAFESITADPVMTIASYVHRGIGSWTGLPLLVTPFELLLITGVVIALFAPSGERRAGPSVLGWPALLFSVAVLIGVARGVLGNGDTYTALWEVRYLLYIPACFVIARAALRRPEHVMALLRTGLVASALFSVEAVWRKFALINTGALGVNPEQYFEHDDVIFLATFLILVISVFVFRTRTSLRVLSALAAPILFYVLLASNRRAGIVVALVALLVVALTLLVVKRKAFFASAVPTLVATCIFFALTWSATGVLGQPARAVRSIYEPDPRDASSNVYRLIETYDITVTLAENPILGVGFGRPFQMVAPLPDLSWWPFWHYETHNNVLWIWLKTGFVGYVAFWSLLGIAMSRAAFGAKRLQDQSLRAAALVGLVALVGIVVFGWVDLAFVSGRTTAFLGTLLGMIGVLGQLDRAATPRAPVLS